ncbi:hypothetical protein ABZ137_41840 [Streptomyces bobili]|uniref:hypothetical protein n=1 Tax=Streptomyces bobili TaxID=67280 RepID=UPI0033BCD47E
MNEEAITIKLTRDQAFVLSDWLYQVMFQSDDLEGIVHDRAVWSPIYAISGTLDKTLSEIFMPDYGPRLEAAKERLRADLYASPPALRHGHRQKTASDIPVLLCRPHQTVAQVVGVFLGRVHHYGLRRRPADPQRLPRFPDISPRTRSLWSVTADF